MPNGLWQVSMGQKRDILARRRYPRRRAAQKVMNSRRIKGLPRTTQRKGSRSRKMTLGLFKSYVRVKVRNTHPEWMSSGLLPNPDIAQCSRHFAFVPATEAPGPSIR
jgi:hypothetical protein